MGDDFALLAPRPNVNEPISFQNKNRKQFKRKDRGDIIDCDLKDSYGNSKRRYQQRSTNNYDQYNTDDNWKTEQNVEREPRTRENEETDPQTEGLIRYLQTLFRDLQSGADKDICCRNILSACTGHELEMMCNTQVSFILEKTIAMCKPYQLVDFVQAVATSDITTACSVGCSSFVMQALLMAALRNFVPEKKAEKKPKNPENSDSESDNDAPSKELTDTTFTQFVEAVSRVLVDNLLDVICHRNASPVLRNLFQVVGGCVVGKNIVNSKRKRTRQEEEVSEKAGAFSENQSVLNSVDVPSSFGKILKKVVSTLKKCEMGDFLFDDKAAPALEVLLLILHRVKRDKCYKLITRLTECVPNLDEQSLTKIGSYVLQNVLSLCDEQLFNKLWSERFKGKFNMLAVHSLGNYIAKELCSRCSDKEQLMEMFEEFSEVAEAAWKLGHFDIFVALSEACVKHKGCQKKFIKILYKILQCEDKKSLVPLLASQLDPVEFDKLIQQIDQMSGESGWREMKELSQAKRALVRLHGSLIIQNLCKFDKTSKICKSLLSIPPERLVDMLCSATGSFIMNAFMESPTVSVKNKENMFQLLKGFYPSLATDKFGSRVIEVMWDNLEVENRTNIMEEISQNKYRLQSTSFGYIILNKFEYLKFVENKEAWTKRQAGKIRTKFSFDAMLKGQI